MYYNTMITKVKVFLRNLSPLARAPQPHSKIWQGPLQKAGPTTGRTILLGDCSAAGTRSAFSANVLRASKSAGAIRGELAREDSLVKSVRTYRRTHILALDRTIGEGPCGLWLSKPRSSRSAAETIRHD